MARADTKKETSRKRTSATAERTVQPKKVKAKQTKPKRAPTRKKAGSPKSNGYRPNLLVSYHESVIPMLSEKLNYRNALEVPRLEKIALNIGIGKAKEEPAALEHAKDDLATISGQKAVVTRAKRAISNFKLRVGDPVGCRVTLRRWHMYEFLERLITIALPRVRDFSGFSVKSFDGRGNLNFGIEEQIVFPEIDYDKIDKIRGLNVSIITTCENDEEGYELLKALGFPFREENPFRRTPRDGMEEATEVA